MPGSCKQIECQAERANLFCLKGPHLMSVHLSLTIRQSITRLMAKCGSVF